MGPGARTSDGFCGGRGGRGLLFQTCWDEQVGRVMEREHNSFSRVP